MEPLRERGMRSRIVGLTSGSVVLIAEGALTDWIRLIGIGAWMLIAAGFWKMIYRP